MYELTIRTFPDRGFPVGVFLKPEVFLTQSQRNLWAHLGAGAKFFIPGVGSWSVNGG